MEKRYYSPLELLGIATQHAQCADELLCDVARKRSIDEGADDPLFPVISLMYMAFELTLRAYLLHVHGPVKQAKNLSELVEMNRDVAFTSQDVQLLKTLSQQYAFRKGVDYKLWEDQQELQKFCSRIVSLYEQLQNMMPLELQADYQ